MHENVLVTGSSGFLGARIVARLQAAGHGVTGIDPVPPASGAAHRHVTDDLSDARRLGMLLAEAGTTHIIHAGGVSGPMVLADQPLHIMDINVGGSLALLQAGTAAGVRRFVYCSSISAIGPFEGGPLQDDVPMQPDSAYGASKAAVDTVLRGLHGRQRMELCSLRLTSVYGPGRRTRNVLSALVTAGLEGREARVSPHSAMPLVFVEDAAEAAVAATFSPVLRQLFYNVAHPEMVSLEDVAAAMRACGVPVDLVPDASLRVARRGTLAVEAVHRDLGFAARIDHREGIHRMVMAMRSDTARLRHPPSAVATAGGDPHG